jgi:hypothetical protein
VGPFLQTEPTPSNNIVGAAKYQKRRALLGHEPRQTGSMLEEITIHGNQIVLWRV